MIASYSRMKAQTEQQMEILRDPCEPDETLRDTCAFHLIPMHTLNGAAEALVVNSPHVPACKKFVERTKENIKLEL